MHTINTLRFFGKNDSRNIPKEFHLVKGFPLEGFSLTITSKGKILIKKSWLTSSQGDQHIQNFIKIVSTKYEYSNGTEVWSSMYAGSHYRRPEAEVQVANRIPGLIFDFDISPMLLTHRDTRKPLANFLTDICAIVGGVLTVAALVDGLVFKADRAIRQKRQLGKLT